MEKHSQSRQKEILSAVGVVVVIAVIAVIVVLTSKKHVASTADTATTQSTQQSATNSQSATSTASSTASTTTYKDGTYNASGSYDSPGGNESIKVSLTLVSGKVTAATATSGANDSVAEEYQSQFIAGYKQLVVGKSISSLSLSRVSGSSLTSQGFNNAVNQIKQQASS